MKLLLRLVTGSLLAWGVSQDCFAAGEYDRGKEIYQSKCIFCHGEAGTGNGPIASSFGHAPANLTQEKLWKKNADQKIAEAVNKVTVPCLPRS